MNTTTEVDVHYSSTDLQNIKEHLIAIDIINQLDLADGLKGLLISNRFTLRSLLNTSTSELAEILAIDGYVAKLISDAAKKMAETTVSNNDRIAYTLN